MIIYSPGKSAKCTVHGALCTFHVFCKSAVCTVHGALCTFHFFAKVLFAPSTVQTAHCHFLQRVILLHMLVKTRGAMQCFHTFRATTTCANVCCLWGLFKIFVCLNVCFMCLYDVCLLFLVCVVCWLCKCWC